MPNNNILRPQSRPDRRWFWVRFRHPVTGMAVYANLGSEQAEAEEICADLRLLLSKPHTWAVTRHPDLDGLHETAHNIFFGHLREATMELQLHSFDQQLEMLKLQLERVSLQVDNLWAGDPGRKAMFARGEISANYGFGNKSAEFDCFAGGLPSQERPKRKNGKAGLASE
jgi:hypothetical protein